MNRSYEPKYLNFKATFKRLYVQNFTMKVDIQFSSLIFPAPILFLKVASEILVAAKVKTKISPLGYTAP